MAWGAWLQIPTTLLTPASSSVVFGASYIDVYATIPFLWASLAVLIARRGCWRSWHGFSRRGWPLPLAVALYVVVSMIAGGVYAGFVQRFLVTPNEQDKEQPFIVHNIAATRRAYALDQVEERELSGDAELTAQDIIAERRHDRERPALGSPAAAADVRADSGDPDVLRLPATSTTTATSSTASRAR